MKKRDKVKRRKHILIHVEDSALTEEKLELRRVALAGFHDGIDAGGKTKMVFNMNLGSTIHDRNTLQELYEGSYRVGKSLRKSLKASD